MNLDKCYFRYVENEERVEISFLFKVKETVRQFNLSRQPSELLKTLSTRIGTNVQKVVNKGKKKKVKSEDDKNNTEIDVIIMDSSNNCISLENTCKHLFSFEGEVKLKIYDTVYDAVFNSPWVVSINLPQSILAGFLVYPEYFVIHYANQDNCTFNWYRGKTVNDKGNELSEIHIKWDKIAEGFFYTPTIDEIGMKIKLECIPGDGEKTGPAVEVISKSVVGAGPGYCPFEARHDFTKSKLNGSRFRCVTYNILADLYCDSEVTRTVLHPYCPPYALHIDYRKQLILKELIGYNADILCLQEVDVKIFKNHLKPLLENEGLEGLFYKKSKDVAEGLACFYRKNRFTVIGEERIVLAEALKNKPCVKHMWDAVKDNQPLRERILDRSSVASASFLQSSDNPNEIIIVGNTHLYFHPDADHIRLLQGGIVIYWLKDIKTNLIKQYPEKRISIILSGDFNSVPSCGIYQLYTTGYAPSTLEDWKSKSSEAIQGLSLKQEIVLSSACGTPQYTNFTAGFADCLDYIFYEKNNFNVLQVVPFPSTEELTLHTALPSIVFPSDHIALISDLQYS